MAIAPSYYLEPLPTDDLPRRLLDAFEAILAHSNYAAALEVAARSAARCGRCAVTCPVYQATGEARDVPCNRSELVLAIYRRYFTPTGALLARFGRPFELDEAHIDRMAEELYRCTACRRCRMECPLGIDHGLITRVGRWALSEVGIVPKALRVSVRAQLEGPARNTSAIPEAAMRDSCEFLVDDCRDTHGIEIQIPIDVEGAEHVFFPPVSDFLMEPDTLMGNAAVLTAAGVSWTLGSRYYDGINYGLFYSDRVLADVLDLEMAEVRRLSGSKILIGECGHASRTAKHFARSFGGPETPEVVNCVELLHRLWKAGRVSLRAGAIEERVTYHDPCNIARSGWIVDQPREVLRHIAKDFVEMTPRGRDNYCCGGGGGTVSIDEIRPFRTAIGGKAKADQIRKTGAKVVVAPCANCKKQLAELIEEHGLEGVRVQGLHDLVLEALEPPESMRAPAEGEDEEEER